jgi:hypothetical protein
MTRARIPAVLAAAAVCLPVVGCGDDDEGEQIPQAKADRLITELEVAQQHVQDEACDEAATAVAQARATVDTLDENGVGADVQDALGDGVDNLSSLVSRECRVADEDEETVPETTPTETTPTETTPTETTPTETTPTETTSPTPIEPEPLPGEEEEPDESDGGAQFIPPGQAKKGGED